MKFIYQRTVAYQHVGQNLQMRTDAMVRLMQAAGIGHSDKVGFGIDKLFKKQLGWMLFRTIVRIEQFPKYGQSFRIETWLNRYSRYKAYRCFRFFCDDRVVGEAVSLYFFFNMATRQFEHVTPALVDAYKPEPDEVTCQNIDTWKPASDWQPERQAPFSIRYADLDTNGHVNHTVYFAFLETALFAQLKGPIPPVEIRVQFSKEIGQGIRNCQVSLGRYPSSTGGYGFTLHNDQRVFTQGDIEPIYSTLRRETKRCSN